MGWQDDAIVEPAAAPAAKQPWEKDAIVAPAAGPRVASGIGEAWQAGYQGSLAGLVDRGKLPDVVLDAHHSKWYEKLVAGASQMVNEGPEMLAGAVGGGAAGTLVAGPVGTVIGGGAGAFAVPTAIRESLVQYYQQRDGVSSADFLARAGIVIKHTAKDAVIGAATAGAGVVAGKVAAPLVESAVAAGRIGETAGKVAAGTAVAGAEIGTMTVLPAAMEGRLPEPEDFMNAAILVGGLKSAGVAAGKLRQIYAETGKRPEQVLVDAQKDPTIVADLVAPVEGDAPLAMSKVVDASGKPITVYHGTDKAFDTFDPSSGGMFTSNRDRAANYAMGSQGRVVEAQLDIRNPMPWGEAFGKTPEEIKAAGYDGTIQWGKNGEVMRAVVVDPKQVLPAEAAVAATGAAGIPSAYQAEVSAQRAADAFPGVKAEEVLSAPYAEVPETKLPYQLNTRTINAPADIHALQAKMSATYMADINAARGGKQSWAETENAAAKQVADLTGTEVSKIMAGRQVGETANAIEMKIRGDMLMQASVDAAAAIKRYHEAGLNATPEMKLQALEAIHRSAIIQAEFTGASAEVARSLNYLRQIKEARQQSEGIKKLTELYGDDPDLLLKMAGEMDNPTAMAKFARDAGKATKWQMVWEAWKAGLVSGPITQVANVMGNTTFMAARPLVDVASVPFGVFMKPGERVHAVEPLARVVGNLQGVSDGLRMARVAFMEDAPAGIKADHFRKAIPGTAGYVIRTPFRALSAMDALFRNMAERGEVNAIAAREAAREGFNPATREYRERMAEIAQNLTPEQAKAAEDFAVRATFQAEPGNVAKKVFAGIDAIPGSELIVPFKITPLNVFKEAMRISPAAPLVGEWRAALAKGGPEAQRAMAELAVGAGIAALTASWALSGNISGNGDPDPNKRRAAIASGWQPYSIKIDGKWYSYQRMAPLGLVIGAAADAAAISEHATPEESGTVAKMVAAMFANAVTNATFLQGVTQLNNVINDPQRYGPSFINGLAASPVPAAVSQTASLLDPYQREVGSVIEAIKNRIPGVREGLTPTRDIFGEPVPNPNTAFAVKVSKESDDPVRKEAARLGAGMPEAPKSIEMQAGGDTKLGKVALTQEQRDIFGDVAGHLAHDIMTPMVNSPGWSYMPDFVKQKAFKMVFEKAREAGKHAALTDVQRQQEIQRITTEIGKRLSQ